MTVLPVLYRLKLRSMLITTQTSADPGADPGISQNSYLGRGLDAVGNPRRARISQFELVEHIISSWTNGSLSSDSRQQYLSQQYPPPLLTRPCAKQIKYCCDCPRRYLTRSQIFSSTLPPLRFGYFVQT